MLKLLLLTQDYKYDNVKYVNRFRENEMKIVTRLQWIHSDCGGRKMAPVDGLRPSIRWQKTFNDEMKITWDVTITKLDLDEKQNISTAELCFSKRAVIPLERLKEGVLIELLDGYRTIAVGKIIDTKE